MFAFCLRRRSSPPLARSLWTHHCKRSSLLLYCTQGGGMRIYAGTVTITSTNIHSNTATSVSAHPLLETPFHTPNGRRFWTHHSNWPSLLFACTQGGGMFISGSSTQVTITNTNIYSNTAPYVSAHPLLEAPFQPPLWPIIFLLTCLVANHVPCC